ncbi:MAG: type VI secretion system lipoprotein TssJ [Hydrogenophaga sp.]|uniref:type VI secretion system lipoprotein TssJ n=1 Tax=Hydrogenophaga sp. TaxID=1904254 RepID=UPI003D9AEDCE
MTRSTGRCALTAMVVLAGSLLSGCGTTSAGGGLLDKTLGLVGLQTVDSAAAAPISPEMLKPAAPTKVPLRIHASDQLNSDGAKRPLSLVVKVYKLKAHEDFMRAPYDAFAQAPYKGDEVISSRELVLLPGQRYEVEEALPKDAAYLGVVALFKSPEAYRWRFVFDLASSAKEGVTLGAHQCALSVSQGETVGSAIETRRLAGTVCR